MAISKLALHPLTLTALTTAELASSPHLPGLYDLILLAFDHSHRTGYETLLLTEPRLQAPAQITEELGSQGFCILAFTPSNNDTENEGKLIATASAKPYIPPGATKEEKGSLLSEVNKMFKRAASTQIIKTEDEVESEGLPAWEVLLMAVTPEMQGRGIASRLLALTMEEIQRRVTKESAKEGAHGNGKVKILLSTMKELNEEYYKRKGWTTTSERRFEAGVGGSEAGFGIVEMVRVVA